MKTQQHFGLSYKVVQLREIGSSDRPQTEEGNSSLSSGGAFKTVVVARRTPSALAVGAFAVSPPTCALTANPTHCHKRSGTEKQLQPPRHTNHGNARQFWLKLSFLSFLYPCSDGASCSATDGRSSVDRDLHRRSGVPVESVGCAPEEASSQVRAVASARSTPSLERP